MDAGRLRVLPHRPAGVAGAVTEAREVDGDDAPALAEFVECVAPTEHAAAEAVDEHNRFTLAGIDVVHQLAIHHGQHAGSR